LGEATLDTHDKKQKFLGDIIIEIINRYPCCVLGFIEMYVLMVVCRVDAAVIRTVAFDVILGGPNWGQRGCGDAVLGVDMWIRAEHPMWSTLDDLYANVKGIVFESTQQQVGKARPRSQSDDGIDRFWLRYWNAMAREIDNSRARSL
jgi:hypothetical protein